MEPLDNISMGADGLSSRCIQALQQTRPWMIFLGVMGFIVVLIGILSTIYTFNTWSQISGKTLMTFSIISTIISTAISFTTYLFLIQSAGKIKQFTQHENPVALEQALGKYKNYWLLVCVSFAFSILSGIIMASMGTSRFLDLFNLL